MERKRKQWFLTAGIFFSAAAVPLAAAGELVSSPPVRVTTGVITITQDAAPGNDAIVPPPATVKPADSKPRKAASPYNSAPRDASWQATDLSPTPTKGAAEPQALQGFKPASPAVEASAPCEVQGRYASGDAQPVPSNWERCRAHLQDAFLGYPGEWAAPALGEFLYLHNRTQVANGTRARMTLYHYDFEGDGLNWRGKDQVAKIAALLPQNFFPVVIERITPEDPARPALDEARRRAREEARRRLVLNELAKFPFPIPRERVVIGVPIAEGLSGVEAEIIYRNLLKQTTAGGSASSGAGGGAAGGAGAGIAPATPTP